MINHNRGHAGRETNEIVGNRNDHRVLKQIRLKDEMRWEAQVESREVNVL